MEKSRLQQDQVDQAYNYILKKITESDILEKTDVNHLISELKEKYSIFKELAFVLIVRAWYSSDCHVQLINIPHFSEKHPSRTTSKEVTSAKITGQPKIIYKWQKCGSNCRCNNGRGHGPYAHEVLWDKEKKKYIWKYLGKIEEGIQIRYRKCGKKNCKCNSGRQEDLHGPYKYNLT